MPGNTDFHFPLSPLSAGKDSLTYIMIQRDHTEINLTRLVTKVKILRNELGWQTAKEAGQHLLAVRLELTVRVGRSGRLA